MAGIFGKTPLESPWKELFADIVKLSEFTQQNRKVQVRDALIENYDISGVNLHDAVFEKTEWKNVIAKKIVTGKAVFKDSKFEKVSFVGANFSEVLFENSEFIDVEFDEAQLIDVRFVNCKFKGTDFWKLQHSKIKFEHARIEKSQFNDSSAELAFANSILNDVDMRSLQAPSSLTFEKSELIAVNLSRSVLERFELTDSKVGKTEFNSGRAGTVSISGSDIRMDIVGSTVSSFLISTSSIKLAVNDSRFGKLDIKACRNMEQFVLRRTSIGTANIEGCLLNNWRSREASIDVWNVKDSQIANSKFDGMKVKTATLENVTLDKELNFTNAHIDQLTTKNITKLPGLNLITTGSNVKLN